MTQDTEVIQDEKNEKNNEGNPEGSVGEKPNELRGIGGWLILVAIGIVITPFQILKDIGEEAAALYANGTYELLTNPESSAYSPFWEPYIRAETFINGITLLASIVLIFIFFAKKRFFPKLYIIFLVVSAVLLVMGTLILKLSFPEIDVFDSETTRAFVRAGVSVGIWVPYLLVSKRVKATFVK